MNKATIRRIVALFLILSLSVAAMGFTTLSHVEETVIGENAASSGDIESFVKRMYNITLDREPEQDGFKYWCDQLSGRKITAGGVAYQFVFSPEFDSKIISTNMSCETYITYHYRLLMDREPESTGLSYWKDYMGSNWNTLEKRNALFSGFVNSPEFQQICANYGVLQGYYDASHTPQQNANVALFAERMYEIILGRPSESDGLFYWSKMLMTGSVDGVSVGYEFVFSKEFLGMNLSNEEFITRLYRAFMNREPDQAGMQYWLALLSVGAPREAIWGGFVHSPEFTAICQEFGIIRGSKEVPSMENAEMLVAVNKKRAENGAQPLIVDDLMQQWADIRAPELAVKFSHYRPDGSPCFKVAQDLGIPYTAAAENIAAGYPTAMAAMDAWMNSDGHRTNMMNPIYNHVALGKYTKGNTTYWVMVFAQY